MTVDASPMRAEARAEPADAAGGGRLLALRLANYVTNHVVNHVPSFALRHAWYRHVLAIRIGPNAGVHLGCYVWFYSRSQIRRDAVAVGARTRINRGCCLDVRGAIRIGDDVSISPEVMILTAAHDVDDPAFGVATREVVVEDHVYVGSRATIMPGVRLGRGSVVAAGAVVTRDVAPLAIVAGVPARPVGTRPPDATTYALAGALPLFE